jgi:hypothetical protein
LSASDTPVCRPPTAPRPVAREAGARVGKARQAIIKAIRKGTISAAQDESGEWRIEPIELFRVYPSLSPVDGNQPATESGLRREIEVCANASSRKTS